MLNKYFADLFQTAKTGDAREESFYPDLKDLWIVSIPNKWLKDRRERELSLDEIKHYCKVVTTLQKTIEIQEKIDEIYPEVEEETSRF